MQDTKTDISDNGDIVAYPSPNLPSDGKNTTGMAKHILSGKNKYFGKFILIVFITSCAVIVLSSVISKTRIERLCMQEAKKMLEKQSARLESENFNLEKEYDALKNDSVRIEKEARDQFGFVKPDEVVYPTYNFQIKGIKAAEPVKVVTSNKWKAFLLEGPFPWQFPALVILIATAYYLISYYCEHRKLHQSNS